MWWWRVDGRNCFQTNSAGTMTPWPTVGQPGLPTTETCCPSLGKPVPELAAGFGKEWIERTGHTSEGNRADIGVLQCKLRLDAQLGLLKAASDHSRSQWRPSYLFRHWLDNPWVQRLAHHKGSVSSEAWTSQTLFNRCGFCFWNPSVAIYLPSYKETARTCVAMRCWGGPKGKPGVRSRAGSAWRQDKVWSNW